MYYVYVLRSTKNGQIYVGYSEDLKARLSSHNKGLNPATKPYVPWELVYYEAYQAKTDALVREKRLKHHGKGLYELKRRIGLG